MMTVYLELRHPRRIPISAFEKYWVDESHQHVVLYKAQTYYTIPLWQPEPKLSPALYNEDPSKECLFARLSLDLNLLALQRSSTVVEVVDYVNQREWLIDVTPKPSSRTVVVTEEYNSILPNGIIWSEHHGNSQDLIIVTEKSVDFYKVSVKRGQCKLSRSLTHPGVTRHFWYHPEQRVILLSTGAQGNDMRAYYLRFEVTDMPRFELPPPEKVPRFELPVVEGSLLCPDDVALVRLYGHMYAAHVNSHYSPPGPRGGGGEEQGSPPRRGPQTVLSLYSLEKDQVANSHNFLLYAPGPYVMSVADNILCVHHREFKVTMLYDPLWRPPAPAQLPHSPLAVDPSLLEPFCGGSPVAFHEEPLPPPPLASPPTSPLASPASIAASAWPPRGHDFYDPTAFVLCHPCWALDVGRDCVWSLRLHIHGISDANRSPPKIVPFLLQRGRPFPPRLPGASIEDDIAIGEEARGALLSRMREYVSDGITLQDWNSLLTRVFRGAARAAKASKAAKRKEDETTYSTTTPVTDEQEMGGAAHRRGKSSMSGVHGLSQLQRGPEGDLVITQGDLYDHVLAPLLSASPPARSPPPPSSSPPRASRGLDQSHVCALVVQTIGMLQDTYPLLLPVEPRFSCLAVTVMAAQGRDEELIHFLRFQQVALDSEPLASLLLDLVRKRPNQQHDDAGVQLQQLVRDMLYRLGRTDALITELLRTTHLPEALRTLRHHCRRGAGPHAPSADMVRAVCASALERTRGIPPQYTSRRAATLYLLHDSLKGLDSELFQASNKKSTDKSQRSPSATTQGPTSPEPQRPRFTDIIPQAPFDGLVPDSVRKTLAEQIFGYAPVGADGLASK